MPDSYKQFDPWRIATVMPWFVFFLMGLAPEWAFYGLRKAGAVYIHNALVNSSMAITLALAGFLGVFAYRKCRQGGAKRAMAQGRGLQTGVLGLVAFLSMPGGADVKPESALVVMLLRLPALPDDALRNTVLAMGILKLGAWCYLFALVIRYSLSGSARVFMELPSIFPSSYRHRSSRSTASRSIQAPPAETVPDHADADAPVKGTESE